MTKIIYSAVVEAAKMAVNFRDMRAEHGMPIGTPRQITEAKKYLNQPGGKAETPLNIEVTALHVPLSKKERRAYEQSDEAIAQSFKYTPLDCRGENTKVTVDPEVVEELIETHKCKTAADIVVMACAVFKYPVSELERIKNRVERWVDNSKSKRMPEHIRQKAVFLSLIASGSQAKGIQAV